MQGWHELFKVTAAHSHGKSKSMAATENAAAILRGYSVHKTGTRDRVPVLRISLRLLDNGEYSGVGHFAPAGVHREQRLMAAARRTFPG